MSPAIALIGCIFFIIYLYWRDHKYNKIRGVSHAIWIPFLWILPTASRVYSFWLWYFLGIGYRSASMAEGSPLDRLIQLTLIIAGILILNKRKINVQFIFKHNFWIFSFFIYGFISILWSDFPFISFKRLVKAFGQIIMVLVILTENRPYEAFGVLLKRLSILLLPLSVVFIKYFPAIGRSFHDYAGTAMYTGVSAQKNGLGQLCIMSGIYFYWKLLFDRLDKDNIHEKIDPFLYTVSISMILWLLYMSNSVTALICLLFSIFILSVARLPTFESQPKKIFIFVFLISFFVLFIDYVIGLKSTILAILGRRPDLTDRVPMWEDLLTLVENPIFGFGYESFWLGERLQYMVENYAITSHAHNGYLEMYLNLGLVGLGFLLMWFLTGYRNIYKSIAYDLKNGILRFTLISFIILYNWTEATFFGLTKFWLFLFLSIFKMQDNIAKHDAS